jgi:nitroreductase
MITLKMISIAVLAFLAGFCIKANSTSISKKVDRTPEVPSVDPLFLNRWSPRAMADKEVSKADLMALFEAARWAPSSYNEQPWRFMYAQKGTKAWNTFMDLLVPFNQEWCKSGSVLVVILSKNTSSRGGLNSLHTFDAGSAWQNLALQGSLKDLVVHGMAGFDYEKARTVLQVPEDYTIEAMCVIGHPGTATNLPESMREMEKPSGRKPLAEIVCEGTFGF